MKPDPKNPLAQAVVGELIEGWQFAFGELIAAARYAGHAWQQHMAKDSPEATAELQRAGACLNERARLLKRVEEDWRTLGVPVPTPEGGIPSEIAELPARAVRWVQAADRYHVVGTEAERAQALAEVDAFAEWIRDHFKPDNGR